jgi:hypothetical protein
VARTRPSGKVEVLFSGSELAFDIWFDGHLIPVEAAVERADHFGDHGRGNCRVLSKPLEVGIGGQSLSTAMNSDCFSTRKGGM